MTSVPTTYEAFIQACLGAKLQQDCLPILPDNIDLEQFLLDLDHHRLANLFDAWLVKDQVCWPSNIKQQLHKQRLPKVFFGQAFARELAKILTTLQSSSIPVIVLKGWALIQSLYEGDPSRRRYYDADLLIPSGFSEAGIKVLLGMGYLPMEGEISHDYNRRYAANMAFIGSEELMPGQGRVLIELHWGLIHLPFFGNAIDYNGVFARAQPISIDGVSTLELDPIDTLIHLCAHKELHHASETVLVRDYELAAWIHLYRHNIDWQVVVERSQQWRLSQVVKRAVEKVEYLWPGTISQEIFVKIKSMRSGYLQKTCLWIENSGFTPFKIFEIFAFLPVPVNFQFLVNSTFPSRKFMIKTYGKPPLGFWPLLYVTRLGKTLTEFLKLHFKH